jgi:hypothetical protein
MPGGRRTGTVAGETSEAEGRTVQTMTIETRRKLDSGTRLLLREFGSLPPDEIVREVEAAAARLLSSARFDEFIPVLAHRSARNRLRGGSSSEREPSPPDRERPGGFAAPSPSAAHQRMPAGRRAEGRPRASGRGRRRGRIRLVAARRARRRSL